MCRIHIIWITPSDCSKQQRNNFQILIQKHAKLTESKDGDKWSWKGNEKSTLNKRFQDLFFNSEEYENDEDDIEVKFHGLKIVGVPVSRCEILVRLVQIQNEDDSDDLMEAEGLYIFKNGNLKNSTSLEKKIVKNNQNQEIIFGVVAASTLFLSLLVAFFFYKMV